MRILSFSKYIQPLLSMLSWAYNLYVLTAVKHRWILSGIHSAMLPGSKNTAFPCLPYYSTIIPLMNYSWSNFLIVTLVNHYELLKPWFKLRCHNQSSFGKKSLLPLLKLLRIRWPKSSQVLNNSRNLGRRETKKGRVRSVNAACTKSGMFGLRCSLVSMGC